MKKIVAKTLQDALLKASEELHCSVVDLEYEIVQNPSNGILGIGRKDAIIIVDEKKIQHTPRHTSQEKFEKPTKNTYTQEESIWGEGLQSKPTRTQNLGHRRQHTTPPAEDLESAYTLESYAEVSTTSDKNYKNPARTSYSQEVFDEIKAEVRELFSYLPFAIDSINVEPYKENMVAITLDGPDCALLIGEKGYRYKAISYLLFNWIHPKYGYGVRLEIAEFLRNQEQMIDVYLDNIARIVRTEGRAQTKVLDGVLAYIALGKLRVIFPHKYISFRLNEEGQRYIIIDDFKPL